MLLASLAIGGSIAPGGYHEHDAGPIQRTHGRPLPTFRGGRAPSPTRSATGRRSDDYGFSAPGW